jgi:ubiquinone/menaquinone biosynthesis C-methylase UbiE
MGIRDSLAHELAKTYWREAPIVTRLHPYLRGATHVLDIGAGGCRIAQLIEKTEGIKVTAIDVVDHNFTDLPLTLYDGTTLPFSDDAFDVSMLVFVLHHAREPAELLREAMRVTRSAVLIVEDIPGNVVERALWRMWDNLLNHCWHDDVDIAHMARGLNEWQQFISDVGTTSSTALVFRTIFPVLATYPHVLLHVALT